VGDPVQPRAQRDRPVAVAQAAVCAEEDILQRVLGVGARAAEHLARVGQQAGPIAIVDDAEGVVGAGPEQCHQLLVGAQPQQRDRNREAADRYRGLEGRGFHEFPSVLECNWSRAGKLCPFPAAPSGDQSRVTC
jgi:hypothetical protein